MQDRPNIIEQLGSCPDCRPKMSLNYGNISGALNKYKLLYITNFDLSLFETVIVIGGNDLPWGLVSWNDVVKTEPNSNRQPIGLNMNVDLVMLPYSRYTQYLKDITLIIYLKK